MCPETNTGSTDTPLKGFCFRCTSSPKFTLKFCAKHNKGLTVISMCLSNRYAFATMRN